MELSDLAPYRLYFLGGALALAAFSGWKVRDWQCDAAQTDVSRKATKATVAAQNAVNTEAGFYEMQRERLSDEVIRDRTVVRTVYREVGAPPASCAVPHSVVGLLTGAVDRANAAAAGKPVAAVPASAAATAPAE